MVVERMLLGEMSGFFRSSPCLIQISDPKGKCACSEGKHGTQSRGVPAALRLLQGEPDGFRTLFSISLNPKDMAKHILRRDTCVEPGETNLAAS